MHKPLRWDAKLLPLDIGSGNDTWSYIYEEFASFMKVFFLLYEVTRLLLTSIFTFGLIAEINESLQARILNFIRN